MPQICVRFLSGHCGAHINPDFSVIKIFDKRNFNLKVDSFSFSFHLTNIPKYILYYIIYHQPLYILHFIRGRTKVGL